MDGGKRLPSMVRLVIKQVILTASITTVAAGRLTYRMSEIKACSGSLLRAITTWTSEGRPAYEDYRWRSYCLPWWTVESAQLRVPGFSGTLPPEQPLACEWITHRSKLLTSVHLGPKQTKASEMGQQGLLLHNQMEKSAVDEPSSGPYTFAAS